MLFGRYLSPEEIEAFNKQQREWNRHPLTCGGNRTDTNHLDGEGVLVAVRNGLFCPYCSYVQCWSGIVPGLAERKAILDSLPKDKRSHAEKFAEYVDKIRGYGL